MTTYDFIVIGAGSAGCAVAGRLADESSAKVLLIEAGGSDRRLTVRAPLAFPRQLGTSLDWAYESEPEAGCAGRPIPQPRGRVLGGTSAMNAMVWVKGSNLDYDGWGLSGWTWNDVEPVFKRIEDGPMRVTRVAEPDELSMRFVEAARAAGVAAVDDVSGPGLDGAAITPVTIYRGQRWTTARAYLRNQRNLTVVTRADVGRVLIRGGRAVGVEYRRRGRAQQAFAAREVVLSAGAFGTPQLLQLSGIGPADRLRSLGVAPVADSPNVGQGLTDHPNAFAIWSLAPGHVGLADAANPKWLLQWLLHRRGKLTSNGCEAVAHIRSQPDLPACDFQLVFSPADALADPQSKKLVPTVTMLHSYWTPKSRGSVSIRSSDPLAPPVIRLNLLSEREDVDALTRAVQRSREIIGTEPIASAVGAERLPGPGMDIEESVRQTAITTAHPACSVAMGSASDSALDEQLRVRGVAGLRVADASALPRIPRANTNAPSIMIGERCADFLLG
ncbi:MULTISPECIES: GMC family oxidoreductase [Mycobacterium]|uniref:GMC family oxidoreductase n=1 Tax=Mycobacterium TaxID=1763 RepID=UPI001EF10960|nr:MULTISPECIES: GMC family oxidoreductase N-terminal domain-containing protein [Mycobacterium]BDB41990.1 choline dehydrogenase [Mycobacterium kiyosense]BDE14727.1 choline dehydrogenase [Mycobacterium sp. 20KCMC460]GLB90963.1 choline dehydrogenase [Mycobacterium kiyosense]GLC03573.1 choline dehydrogenase [Mycobacterium kiyosense]GLC08568.1 choline dehydrogenase [Mycobacterium kiyosense]